MSEHTKTVLLYLWDVRRWAIVRSFFHMALDRRPLKGNRNVSFFKLLGTGSGETFTPSDANIRRWGMLVVIESSQVEEFDHSSLIRRWRADCTSEYRVRLQPISSHGTWAGRDPFAQCQKPSSDWQGEVAAITRARIATRKSRAFWKAVPPVNSSLTQAEGLMTAIGIGEAPIGLQGTFSIWSDARSIREFAYKSPAHTKAISQTKRIGWYSEELFARFAVLEKRGDLPK